MEFFLVCPIGLEHCLESELKRHLPPDASYSLQKGGISLQTTLESGLALNYWLRIPARILLRLKRQKCRDLPKLFQILNKLPWQQYLQQKNIALKISCHQSRLMHTGRIEQTAQAALAKYFQSQPLAQYHALIEKPPQQIYLRLEQDELTVSLDSSGEHLHKRSQDPKRAKASLRENFAAACLEFLCQGDNSPSFLDPMCGSGTFLNEYANMNSPITHRSFAFEYWKGVKIPKPVFIPAPRSDIKGCDLNPISPAIIQDDFFKTNLRAHTLVMNPPYGKRIKILGNETAYFKRILNRLQQMNAQRAGVIIPFAFAGEIESPFRLNFNQNGIAVSFLCWN